MGDHRIMETIVGVVLIFYLIIGLVGNLLTIGALLRCPRVRNVTAAFIISLCFADCLFCVLVLPWEISRFLVGRWHLGEGAICVILPLIRYWNVAVSLLSIAMITINRYILIAHYGIHRTVYKKIWVILMIVFCWIFPFCMLLPTLLNKWGRFGFIEKLDTCSIIDENGDSPKKALFAIGFLVPAIVIVVCYSLIFYVIHKSELRMKSHMNGNSPQSNGTNVVNKDKEIKRRRSEWRVTKMVLTIFVAFIFSYLPITIIKFIDPKAENSVLHLFGYLLVYISCCINPVIYVIMNRQYRKAYKTILLCEKPKLPYFKSGTSLNFNRRSSNMFSDNEKTTISQMSDSDRSNLPECQELSEIKE